MTGGNEPNAPSPPDLDEGETPASGSAAAAKPLTVTDSFTPLIDVNAFSSSREFPTVETFAAETAASAGSESFRVETWSVEASFGTAPEEESFERGSGGESSIAGLSGLNETPVRETSANELSFSEASTDESFGGTSTDEVSFGEKPYDETALGQISLDEASFNATSSGASALSETVSGNDSRVGEGVSSMPILPSDTVLRSNSTPAKDDASTGGAHQKKYDSKSVPQFDGRTIVSNQGRIAFLMMPNKFVLANHNETEFYSVHEYQVLNYPSMKIGHWEWSRPASQFSDEVAAGFKATLELEPHVLTPEEMEVLEDVIPLEVFGYNGAFDLIALRTEDYGGKTVLVLEVKWWDVDRKAYGMFFSTDESYKFLESVHFEGTEGDYRRTFLSAKASFMRMRWRT